MSGRVLAIALLLAASGCAPSSSEPAIEIDSAWVRPSITAGQAGAGYLTVTNRGDGADRLVGASSEAATRVTLHASSNEGGIARMRPLPNGLTIDGGETVRLEPGGNHLMLEQLKAPLTAGQTVSITLNFEKSGARPIDVRVANGPVESTRAGHEGH